MKVILLMTVTLFTTLFAFAQEAVVSGATQVAEVIVPTADVLKALLSFVTSIKGATSLAIAVGAVQLVILFLNSELAYKLFKKLTPAKKMSYVQGLTILFAILTSMAAGQSFLTALLSGAVLVPLQEYVFQLYKNYLEKKKA